MGGTGSREASRGRATVAAVAAALALALLGGLASGEDGPKRGAEAAPAQADIDAAVKRGADFLARGRGGKARGTARQGELVALTLLHAGLAPEDPAIAKTIDLAASEPMLATYRIALAAMLLEAADRQKYQQRIADLAQTLCDMQCPNGQWSYGEREGGEDDPAPERGGDAREPAAKPGRTEARRHIRLAFHGPKGPPRGDNSNTQFALLGLRAAEDALVEVPQETWALSKRWFMGDVHADGGFGYGAGGGAAGGGHGTGPSYGSMTAVGVGSLAIVDNYLKLDVRQEPPFARASEWLAKKLTFEENPGDPRADAGNPSRHYYWIYAVERAGVLAKTEKFGAHAWYAEGARYLLAHQDADGGWDGNTLDTCFAILFLKRATAPLRPRVYTPG
jgi:hypothetical protein